MHCDGDKYDTCGRCGTEFNVRAMRRVTESGIYYCFGCDDEDCRGDDYEPFDDDYEEPVGSCEWCGTNLYPDDDEDLCDQCLWHAEQNRGGDDSGIQPVV